TLGGLLAGGLWYEHERGERVQARLADAEEALREGELLLRPTRYGDAAARLNHGLKLAEATEGGGDLARRVRAPLGLGRRAGPAAGVGGGTARDRRPGAVHRPRRKRVGRPTAHRGTELPPAVGPPRAHPGLSRRGRAAGRDHAARAGRPARRGDHLGRPALA